MVDYTISYRDGDGAILSEEDRAFRNDDAAIDAVGDSPHPFEILLTQGARLVARFGAWPAPSRPF